MTPDQVSGFFDAGESFVEGTIAAALVVALDACGRAPPRPALHGRATPASSRSASGADLWWIIYVALRDIILVQVFLGSFIFFYPDVVTGQDLPITGGLAAVCAFAVLLIKLVTKGDADVSGYRWQVILIGLGAALYIVPVLPRRPDDAADRHSGSTQIMPLLVSSKNPDVALPLCYLSGDPGRRPRA